MMSKRTFLMSGLAALGVSAAALAGVRRTHAATAGSPAQPGPFEITHSEEEWRKLLSPEQFYVLRQHGTERAGTSPLDKEHRTGTFACAGCELPLFLSTTKYDSGTGWPSFWAPIEGAIGTSEDKSFFAVRTEVHCRRCGGHLGHVFDDGPPPTGLRYCMNGVALVFVPA